MARETGMNSWRVKVSSISPSITRQNLAELFQIDNQRICIPRQQNSTQHYAWIDSFQSEHDAQKFVDENPRSNCKVVPPKNSVYAQTPNKGPTTDNEQKHCHRSRSARRDDHGSNRQLNCFPTSENCGHRNDMRFRSIPPTARPKPGSQHEIVIIELSDCQHNFLASFGEKYSDDIRQEPGIVDVRKVEGKMQLTGHFKAIENATEYLKSILHDQNLKIGEPLKKYLEWACQGFLLKKFAEKHRVGISFLKVSTSDTNDYQQRDKKNSEKATTDSDANQSVDEESSGDDDGDTNETKSNISKASSKHTTHAGNGRRSKHMIQVTLCSDSVDSLSKAVNELQSYSLYNQSWALTAEEVAFIQKQPCKEKPPRKPPTQNRFNQLQVQNSQMKKYLFDAVPRDDNAIVQIYVNYIKGVWRVKVSGFESHVKHFICKLKAWLDDNVQTEIQLPISKVMAIFLRQKASLDIRKLEKDQLIKITVYSPFSSRQQRPCHEDDEDEHHCLKLSGPKSRIRIAQKHVENFQDCLVEKEENYLCQSWDLSKEMGRRIRTYLKKISDSDDHQAIGWLKIYKAIEKRETEPKITVSMAGFTKEDVDDIHEQCKDIVEGYVIWKPSEDEFRRIFQALVVKKSPPRDEFERQYQAEVCLDRKEDTITIIAGSKMLADEIKDALLSLREAKTSQIDRISESIPIALDIRRFVMSAIRPVIDEAKPQGVGADLKKRDSITLHGRSDIVKKLKETINSSVIDIRQKLITRYLQLTFVESDLMRSNSYERTIRIERDTDTIIRDLKADRNHTRSTTEDNERSLSMMTVFNDRGQTIVVAKGDIIKVRNVDAIVNAANGAFYHAGGVDKLIADSAGAALNEECRELITNNNGLPIATGKAVKTTAGNLPFKSVIHAIGPQYIDGNQQERPLLFSCIMASLELADREGYRTIALPAISAKTYGFPLNDCTNIIVRTIKQFFADYPQSKVIKVILIDLDDTVCNAFAREIVVDHYSETRGNNNDDMIPVALSPLKAKWCWEDSRDEKLYTGHDMRQIDNEFDNYLKSFQARPLVIQADNLRSGTIVKYSIHFLPDLKEYLSKNPAALEKRLVCGYQRREDTGFQRNIIRYPVTKQSESSIQPARYRPKPLDSYQQQVLNTDESWRITGLAIAAVDQAEKAIRAAIQSATITEPFSIVLDKDCDEYRKAILFIAKQGWVELCFSAYKAGQLSMTLKGFKINIAETKSNIAIYANDHWKRGVENDDDIRIPNEWCDQNDECILIEMSNHDPTFTRIENRMKETLSNVKIHRIERVQNIRMWNYYAWRRRELKKELRHLPHLPIEMELFHGTRDTSPSEIYNSEYGFDHTFCMSGRWGIGIYFAQNASYSCTDYAYRLTDGKLQVFLAQVLTGDVYTCPSDTCLRRPPKKNGTVSGQRYNSVSGQTKGSEVYIVYEDRVTYPTYLITYTL